MGGVNIYIMKILTDSQREALLKVIADAPDDLLLDAANSVKNYRITVQKSFAEIKGYAGWTPSPPKVEVTLDTVAMAEVLTESKPVEALKGNVDTTMTLPGIEPSKPNIEPSGEVAYKVGSETKALILGYCSTPKTLAHINTHLKRGKGKLVETGALMKRLWSLGLLFFDGELYTTKKSL